MLFTVPVTRLPPPLGGTSGRAAAPATVVVVGAAVGAGADDALLFEPQATRDVATTRPPSREATAFIENRSMSPPPSHDECRLRLKADPRLHERITQVREPAY